MKSAKKKLARWYLIGMGAVLALAPTVAAFAYGGAGSASD
jgi:hypothetical protein